MLITRKSIFTQIYHTREIDVTSEQLDRFEKGDELIQHVFPNLSAEDREFIMTGVMPEEWDLFMGPEDEDELLQDED